MLCVCVFVCDTVFSTKDCCLYIKNETFLYDNTFIPKDAVLTGPDVVPVSDEPVLPIMYIILYSNEYKIILCSS